MRSATSRPPVALELKLVFLQEQIPERIFHR
jgi:hypothetical protein